MTIIGLSGVARSGKDTFGAYLVENHGYTRVALADAVRDAVYTLNPTIKWYDHYVPIQEAIKDTSWDSVKATDEGRRLLQVMGTEVGRGMFGENSWIDMASKKVDEAPGPVVVTDIRFENELKWIKSYFSSKTVKIHRPGTVSINAHVSDSGLSDLLFDTTINNDDTIEGFHLKIERLLGAK